MDDFMVFLGGEVKSLGDGRLGGYLVRFGDEHSPDTIGDFFNKSTDYGDHKTSAVYYQHGLDPIMGRRKLGIATLKSDEFGIWAETQLEIRDKYEAFIYWMAENKKMGWSSGTASHLVDREPRGKANWVKEWPLGLDATLTPNPAEWRNEVLPLKSWKFIEVPEITQSRAKLVERARGLGVEMKGLTADLQSLLQGVDRPLTDAKLYEVKQLLEQCEGIDAVRKQLETVIPPDWQPSPVVSRKLASAKHRLQHILQEK